MHAWESIQKAVDYIEDHIAQEMKLEELAAVAALSPFYFQRLFTRLVRRPVGEYIKLRRLARAADTLNCKDRRILDIALEYGFNSHETFTKAFKSAFGITPDEYRKNPVHLNQIVKPELLLNYTMIDEDVPLITDNIVIEITRKKLAQPERYIGLSGKVPISQTPVGEVTGIDVPGQLWEAFHQKKVNIPGLLADGNELGASMLEGTDGTFTYFAGALADSNVPVPEDCSAYELPAAEYVVCSFEAEDFAELRTAALDKAMKYLFETWLKNRELTVQPFSAEKYYAVDPDASKMEIWVIPAPISKTEIR